MREVKKESMVHTFLYHTVSLLNLAFLKQNLVTKDGDFQVQLYRTMSFRSVLFILSKYGFYLTALLLALIATSGKLAGMCRSVATVSQKLIHTISGLWEHSPAITASQQIQQNKMNFNKLQSKSYTLGIHL
jgi:signal transduction histidine kinase